MGLLLLFPNMDVHAKVAALLAPGLSGAVLVCFAVDKLDGLSLDLLDLRVVRSVVLMVCRSGLGDCADLSCEVEASDTCEAKRLAVGVWYTPERSKLFLLLPPTVAWSDDVLMGGEGRGGSPGEGIGWVSSEYVMAGIVPPPIQPGSCRS